jgi:hypothetical protein
LALEPLISTSIFNDFLTSIKIMKKKSNNKAILSIRINCKFPSLSLIKLLSINVKKVKKAMNSVIIKTIAKNTFFLIKSISIR